MPTAQTLADLATTIAALEAAKDLPARVDELCDLKRRLTRLADLVSRRAAEQRARAREAQAPYRPVMVLRGGVFVPGMQSGNNPPVVKR